MSVWYFPYEIRWCHFKFKLDLEHLISFGIIVFGAQRKNPSCDGCNAVVRKQCAFVFHLTVGRCDNNKLDTTTRSNIVRVLATFGVFCKFDESGWARWGGGQQGIHSRCDTLFAHRLHNGEFGFSVGSLWLFRHVNYYFYYYEYHGQAAKIYNLSLCGI